MKNKKIIHLQAFLFATIIACIIYSFMSFVTQNEALSLALGNLLFAIYFFIFFYIYFVILERNKQISIIAYFDTGHFIEYSVFSSPPKEYSEILEKLSNDEWNKICQKYDKIIDKKRKAEEAENQQIQKEHCIEIQTKINKIMGNCDELQT